MFIFLVLDIVLALEQAPLGRATGRRYSQLTKMMRFYNDDFDERKYWTYGCNCLMLGDRPLSQPGIGPPVDELDTGKTKRRESILILVYRKVIFFMIMMITVIVK